MFTLEEKFRAAIRLGVKVEVRKVPSEDFAIIISGEFAGMLSPDEMLGVLNRAERDRLAGNQWALRRDIAYALKAKERDEDLPR